MFIAQCRSLLPRMRDLTSRRRIEMDDDETKTCFPQIETGPSWARFGDAHKKMWRVGGCYYRSSNRKVVRGQIEYECLDPVYGTRYEYGPGLWDPGTTL